MHSTPLQGRRVLFMSWRDLRNPEGGGAEVYLEQMARGLRDRGATVTIFSAAHAGAPLDETVDGIHYVRRGAKMSVYLRGLEGLLRRRFGRVDIVVDVQNGLPFFSRLLTRRPSVVLVHHVHREQWPVVYPGVTGRVGWWIESRFAPRLYRRSRYVAVSSATTDELVALGVDRDRISIVHNGTETAPPTRATRSETPTVCCVGRLVPHKQVEHAIDAVRQLAPEFPGLRLIVAGDGWWSAELREHARSTGAEDLVEFEGHVTEERKHEIYAESWVMALPSLKEGWGLVIGEAGSHGTPTVAYRAAGGTQESIADGSSGLLVDDEAEFVSALRAVLSDPELRGRLSAGARTMSHQFTWGQAQSGFADVLTRELSNHR